MNSNKLLSIGEVAKTLATTTRTVRYYEEIGLITPYKKTPTSQRLYTSEDVEKIIKIKELHNLMGLKLAEIKRFIEIEDKLNELKEHYSKTTSIKKQAEIIEEALSLYEELISQLSQRVKQIKGFKTELENKKLNLLKKLSEIKTKSEKI